MRILHPIAVIDDIAYSFAHSRIVRECFKPEAGSGMIRELFPDALNIRSCIGKLLHIAVNV